MVSERQSLSFKKMVITEVRHKTVLKTDAGGLFADDIVEHYLKLGLLVFGIDDDSRRRFFEEFERTSWRKSTSSVKAN